MAKQRPVSPAAEALNRRLGAEIGRARKKRDRSQKQLTDALAALVGDPPGKAQTTVSDYETAKTQVPLYAVVDIEDALDLPRGSLLVAAGYVPLDDVIERIRRDPTIDPEAAKTIVDLYERSRERAAQGAG